MTFRTASEVRTYCPDLFRSQLFIQIFPEAGQHVIARHGMSFLTRPFPKLDTVPEQPERPVGSANPPETDLEAG